VAARRNSCGGLVDCFARARARVRAARAHVRNIPSFVPANSTVQNLDSSSVHTYLYA
jgi:hypothetical protein